MLLDTDYHLAKITTDYTCARCNLYQHATVASIGIGAGYFGTAAANAVADSERAIPMLLALKRCPKCGQRDDALAAKNVRTRTAAIVAIGVILLATVVGCGALAFVDGTIGVITLLVVTPLMALIFRGQRTALLRRYPTDTEALVTLVDPPVQAAWNPADPNAPTTADGGWKWI